MLARVSQAARRGVNGVSRHLTAVTRFRWAGIAAIAGVTAAVYLAQIETAPPNLHYDEVLFGLQAKSIADTGRDLNGRVMPLYFQMDASVWFHPTCVYLVALALWVLPVSVTALRSPTAVLGIIDVVLVYFVARKLFRRESTALLAAGLLAATPAHFLHSRLAMDYLYPVPFVLAWLLCLLLYLERRQPWMLFLATSVLGLGIYSYIAAVVMMPIYLLITCIVLWLERSRAGLFGAAVGGFAWPLALLLLFAIGNPEAVSATAGRYDAAGVSTLNPLQRLRESLSPWAVSDWTNHYFRFFSPGYLFVTGGSSLVSSTRQAGVFLWPCAVFLAVGLHGAVVRYTPANLILVAGFVSAPFAASLIPDDFAIARHLELLPFAVLLMAGGIERWAAAPLLRSLKPIYLPVGLGGLAIGVGYAVLRVSGDAPLGGSTILLVTASLAVLIVGRAAERAGRWWPVIAVCLILAAAQSLSFHRDYFGDYRVRSAAWFGGNMREAVVRLADLSGESGEARVLLSAGIPRATWYWEFYLTVIGRADLRGRAVAVEPGDLVSVEIAPGSVLLLNAGDVTGRRIAASRGLVEAEVISEVNAEGSPDSPGGLAAFVIYRRE